MGRRLGGRGGIYSVELHAHILLLAHFGCSGSYIASRLGVSEGVVRSVVGSELGRAVLRSLREEASGAALDVSKEFSRMLVEHMDVPRQILGGRIRQYVREVRDGKEVEVERLVPVSPELRLRAFTDIGRLAVGVHQTNIAVIGADRLDEIKRRARELEGESGGGKEG